MWKLKNWWTKNDWLTRKLVRLLTRRMIFGRPEDLLLLKELSSWQDLRDPQAPTIFERNPHDWRPFGYCDENRI